MSSEKWGSFGSRGRSAANGRDAALCQLTRAAGLVLMALSSFLASLDRPDAAPAAPALRAPWLDAHKCVDHSFEPDAMWVRAYLHRKEGDAWNAGYWYRRAGRPPYEGGLPEEWRKIAAALLDKGLA